MKSVRHKNGFSGLSRITVNTLPNGYVDKCYLLPCTVSEAKVAPAHCCNCCQHVAYCNAFGNATSCHYKSDISSSSTVLSSAVESNCDCVEKYSLWPRLVSKRRCQIRYVGKHRLWPRIVSQAGVALALESRVLRRKNRTLWRPTDATKIMCEQLAAPSSSDMFMYFYGIAMRSESMQVSNEDSEIMILHNSVNILTLSAFET